MAEGKPASMQRGMIAWVDTIDYIHLENDREAARGKHEPPMYV